MDSEVSVPSPLTEPVVTDIYTYEISPLQFAIPSPTVHTLLQALREKGYRRYKHAYCYEPIVDDLGPTHAWKRACFISDFIRSVRPDMSKTSVYNYGDYLAYCDGFADLNPNKHLHAFKNGVYDTTSAVFYPRGLVGGPVGPVGPAADSDGAAGAVARKYYPLDFDAVAAAAASAPAGVKRHGFQPHWRQWRDVPTPNFDAMIEKQALDGYVYDAKVANSEMIAVHQYLKAEVLRWIYVFIGRLLFDVGQHDTWGVVPLFVGAEGTLVDVIWSFFNGDDVGTYRNCSFNEHVLHEARIWHCDLTTTALDPRTFHGMVTGGFMELVRMRKPTITDVWRTPGFLTCSWDVDVRVDADRIVTIVMGGSSEEPDGGLDGPEGIEPAEGLGAAGLQDAIQAELPRILHKCCAAYLEAASDETYKGLSGESFTRLLPAYFRSHRLCTVN